MRYIPVLLILILAITISCEKHDDDNPLILHEDTSLSKGLIAYYPFNLNANDASGNGKNCQVMGAVPVADRNAAVNSAYHFDGNDYIWRSAGLDSTDTTISVSLWVKKTGIWESNYRKLITLGDNNNGVYISEGPSPHLFYFSVKNSSLESFAYCQPPSANVWHHIAAVYNGSDLKLYIDTVLKCTSSCDLHISSSTPFYIGWGSGTEYFTGDLDDIRIYNRALAESEISQLYFKQD